MNGDIVPTEILCNIFLILCEKPIALHVLENRFRFNEFPWAVGRVCRHWREAFISYPPLWTSLSLTYVIDFHTVYRASPDRFNEMNRRTVLYLERSGQLPLNIAVAIQDIRIQTTRFRRNEQVPGATWKSLLSCSDRWKTLDLKLSNLPDVVNGLVECRDKIPILESMNLNVSGWIFDRKVQESTFAVAPRLTDLGLRHHRESSAWTFPWSQLTKFTIEVDNDADLRQYEKLEAGLSQLQNVEELQLIFNNDANYWDSGVFTPASSIRLPSVRFLKVTATCVPYIFEWFETPFLEHLWVHDFTKYLHQHDEQTWNTEIHSFISRSSCHIRRLTLQNRYHELDPTLMEGLDSVEHLCIENPRTGTPHLLIRDIASTNGRVFLPYLKQLQVICCPGQADRELVEATTHLLEARGKGSMSALAKRKIIPFEMTVEWGARCNCWANCDGMNNETRIRILHKVMEMIRSCSSTVADISIDEARCRISIKPRLEEYVA